MLLNWNFDNSYLKLPEIFYRFVKADIFPKPKIALLNKDTLYFASIFRSDPS